MLQPPPQLGGAQARCPAAHCPDGPQGAEKTAAVPAAVAEAQQLALAQLQVLLRHGQQGGTGRQGQTAEGHPGPRGGPVPLGKALGRGQGQGQPAPRGQMAAPLLQLGGRLLQPLQGEAGAEQAGAPQPGGQAGVEIPEAVAMAAGQGVGRQQLGAEVELEQGGCQAVLLQGLPQQAAAGPQVGRRAAGQCSPAAPGQQVGQPPGHRPLQAGVLPVGLGGADPCDSPPAARAPWWP